MMVMTAKVDMKKGLVFLGGLAALILMAILLFGGGDTAQTLSPSLSGNDGRVKFLADLGWDVTTSPAESTQVKIPAENSEVFSRYNALQKSAGYDLSKYAGKTAMRYVYKVNNFPGASAPVYATLLIYKNAVIGGDITDTAPGGKIQGLKPAVSANLPTETVTEPKSGPETTK